MPEYTGTATITLDEDKRPVRLVIRVSIKDSDPVDVENFIAAFEDVGAVTSVTLPRVYTTIPKGKPGRKKKPAPSEEKKP